MDLHHSDESIESLLFYDLYPQADADSHISLRKNAVENIPRYPEKKNRCILLRA